MNTVKEEIISKINHYLQWQNIEDFDKIMNYIEFQIYLPPIKKYKVRVSKEISYNQDKASQIKQIALELNHGKSIWHRLSKRTISSYINLPKTLQQRNTSGESCYGKDIMYNLFYIHHLRLGDKLSNTKIKLFDQDVHFLDQKSDELLYVLFDFIESTFYFLDILSHKELYKYKTLLEIIVNNKFPNPVSLALLCPPHREGFTDEEIATLTTTGYIVHIPVFDQMCVPNEMIMLNCFTELSFNFAIAIYNNKSSVQLGSRFLYNGQFFSEPFILSTENV
jgi:hypothetical protein